MLSYHEYDCCDRNVMNRQENVMDDVWEYLQPLVYNSDLLMKYDDFLQNQFGFKENFQVRYTAHAF